MGDKRYIKSVNKLKEKINKINPSLNLINIVRSRGRICITTKYKSKEIISPMRSVNDVRLYKEFLKELIDTAKKDLEALKNIKWTDV
jgi:hypothetical protein